MPDEAGLDGLGRRDRLRDDLVAEDEDGLELGGERPFEVARLPSRDGLLAEVEDLLAEQLQDIQRVLALGLGLARSGADVADEVAPGRGPLLLDDGDERTVEFGNEVRRLLVRGLVLRQLQHEMNDARANSRLLLVG